MPSSDATTQKTEWNQQRELNREIGRSYGRPVILDWYDYVVWCLRCCRHLGGFDGNAWRESGEYWVTCPRCSSALRIRPTDRVPFE